jgi:hypothetical protein
MGYVSGGSGGSPGSRGSGWGDGGGSGGGGEHGEIRAILFLRSLFSPAIKQVYYIELVAHGTSAKFLYLGHKISAQGYSIVRIIRE